MSDVTDIVSAMGGYQAATPQDKTALDALLASRGGRQRTDSLLPTLTLSNLLNQITTSTAAGTKIADIGNAPSQPTVSPNDGRFVIAGSGGAYRLERGTSALTAGTTVLVTISATGALPVAVTLTIAAGTQLLPNPAPPTPAPVNLASPFVLPLTLVGRQQQFTYQMPTSGVTVRKKILMGVNAAGTRGIGMFWENDTTWGVWAIDQTSGSIVQTSYQNQPWYGGSPQAGHEYVCQFYAPDPNLPLNQIPDDFVIMRMFDKANATVSLHNYTWKFLKDNNFKPDFTDCSYMKGEISGPLGATSTPQYVNYGPIPGNTSPLTVVTESFAIAGATTTLTATLDYYKDTGPAPYLAKTSAAAAKAGTVSASSTQGRAIMVFPFDTPPAGTPLTVTYSDADGSPTALGKQFVFPSPMQFGVNITDFTDFYANSPTQNHMAIGGGWRERVGSGTYLRPYNEVNPQLGRDYHPTASTITSLIAANGVGPAIFIKPPRISGQRMRAKWRGTPDMCGPNSANGFQPGSPSTGTDGTYSWFDYNHNYDLADLVGVPRNNKSYDSYYLWFSVNQAGCSEFTCYPIDGSGNALSTGFWLSDYVNDCKKLTGHSIDGIRGMDVLKVIGLYGYAADVGDWAEAGQCGPGGAVGWPDLGNLFEQVGIGGRFHIPLQAKEAYVRKAGQWLKTFLLRTKLQCSVALSNEIWNSGQPSWGTAAALYRQARDAGTVNWPAPATDDGNIQTLRWWSRQQTLMSQWLTEELGEAKQYLSIVLEGQVSNLAVAQTVATYWPGAMAAIDQIDVAPYIGGGVGSDLTADSAGVDTLITRLRTKMKEAHDGAILNRNFALQNNKRFGTYEGGYEDFQNGSLQWLFRTDVRGYNFTIEMLTDYDQRVGNMYRWYGDNGHPTYGLRNFAGQSYTQVVNGAPIAQCGHAFFDKLAATATIS